MGRLPGGAIGRLVVGGGRVDCIRDIFILNKIMAQHKIYILIGTLLGWNILLIAPNYKQKILSPAEVRKMLFIS
jgi:hypothetical protein